VPSDARKRLITALNAPNYTAFQRNVENPASGTFQWFENEDVFRSWVLEEKSSFLWIRGSPGQGKTVLSKFLLQRLQARNAHQPKDYMNIYFFCYDQDGDLRTVNSILRSLIEQLLLGPCQFRKPLAVLEKDPAKIAKSNDTLWDTFKEMITFSTLNTIYCVIDGLDECEKGSEGNARVKLLQWINTLLPTLPTAPDDGPALKFLVTSRPITDISDELENVPCFDLKAHEKDLEIFVEKKMETLPRRFYQVHREKAAKLLLEGAGGTFLWVSIVVKKLAQLEFPNDVEIEDTIKESPTDLDALYHDIFDQIMKGPTFKQKLVTWVAYGQRPLTLAELENALATQEDSKSERSTQRYKVHLTPETLTSIFGVVLECTDNVVYLIHQSAKDFILKSHFPTCSTFCKEFGPELYIAKICMTYLNFDDFKPDSHNTMDISAWKRDYPLLDYAARNWYNHIRHESNVKQISDLLFPIIEPKSSALRFWSAAAGISGVNAIDHPLEVATNANIEWLARYILSGENTTVGVSGDVLEYAASRGSTTIAKAALKSTGNIVGGERAVKGVMSNKNARMEVIEGFRSGQRRITGEVVAEAAKNWVRGNQWVELLTTVDEVEFTEEAMEAIAKYFGENVMRQLLKRGSGIKVTEGMIIAAAGNQKSGRDVMNVLIDGPNVMKLQIHPAVVDAAARNDMSGKDIMGVLLVSNKVTITEDAIIAAIRGFNVEVMQQLLQRNDIRITEKIMTELVKDKSQGNELTKIVLSAYPSLAITEPIITAAAGNWKSGKEVMELLLSKHPNIEITEPVVTAAAENGKSGKEVMELLLSKHPNIEITEHVMIVIARNFDSRIMELLLSKHPNIEITEPVMIAITRNFDSRIMELLLSKHPNIEITELVVTAAAGNWQSGKEVMQLLLSKHPNIEITEPVVTAAARN